MKCVIQFLLKLKLCDPSPSSLWILPSPCSLNCSCWSQHEGRGASTLARPDHTYWASRVLRLKSREGEFFKQNKCKIFLSLSNITWPLAVYQLVTWHPRRELRQGCPLSRLKLICFLFVERESSLESGIKMVILFTNGACLSPQNKSKYLLCVHELKESSHRNSEWVMRSLTK